MELFSKKLYARAYETLGQTSSTRLQRCLDPLASSIHLEHLVILSREGYQRSMGAPFNDAAILHEQDLLTLLQHMHGMRDKEYSLALHGSLHTFGEQLV